MPLFWASKEFINKQIQAHEQEEMSACLVSKWTGEKQKSWVPKKAPPHSLQCHWVPPTRTPKASSGPAPSPWEKGPGLNNQVGGVLLEHKF